MENKKISVIQYAKSKFEWNKMTIRCADCLFDETSELLEDNNNDFKFSADLYGNGKKKVCIVKVLPQNDRIHITNENGTILWVGFNY